MAGRGPAPKGERSRARDTPVFDELTATGELYGEGLPDAEGLLADDDWHPMTVRWWDALRANPLMKDAMDADWAFLLDTALLHHKMWSIGRTDLAAEVRLRVAKYGVTPEDRMRLKVKVETPVKTDSGKASPAGVTRIDERRKRLSA